MSDIVGETETYSFAVDYKHGCKLEMYLNLSFKNERKVHIVYHH